METKKHPTDWYWIAINGASAAVCPFPCPDVEARPTPQMLLGLKTRDKQLDLQKFLLTASNTDIDAFFYGEFAKLVESGEIKEVIPDSAEPPTHEETMWTLKK